MKLFFLILSLAALRAVAQRQPIPLLTIDALNNRLANGKDTTFIINFWATWCVPCLKELPVFETFNKAKTKDKVKILLVNLDVDAGAKQALPLFIKKRHLHNEVWLLNESDQQAFINRIDPEWSGAIPATLIVKGSRRRFFEKEFTYTELETAYRAIQP